MDPSTVGVVVAAAVALLTAIIAKLRCVLRTGDEHCDAGCGFTDQALFPPRGAGEKDSDDEH